MRAEKRFLKRIYGWSFAARFSLGMFGWLLVMLDAPIDIVQDAEFYEDAGYQIALEWLSGRQSETLDTLMNRSHFPVLIVIGIGCFYTLTAGMRVLPLLIAAYCALTSLVPGWIYRITRMLGGDQRAGRIAGWLVAFCPAFVFWSSSLYKEGLIIVFLTAAVLHTLMLQRRYTARSMGIVAICLIMLAALRLYLALISTAAIGVGMLLVRPGAGGSMAARQSIAVLAFGAMALAAAGLQTFQDEVPLTLDEGLYRVDTIRHGLSQSESGYLHDTDVSTLGGAVEALPKGLFYFLTVPWPSASGSVRELMGIPDTALWVLLYLFALIGIGQVMSRDPQGGTLLLTLAVGMACFYAILVGNVGTAYRMRVQFWLMLCPMVGIGVAEAFGHQRSRRPVGKRSDPATLQNDVRKQPEPGSLVQRPPTGGGAAR